ncbi:MAG: alpha-L-fucosidase [Clostridia bacterium]|nr:alpha-L-fucosidase [Clostridia bacterium]
MKYQYIHDFKKLGFGMFVHFGLYSVAAKGEWYKDMHRVSHEKYEKLVAKFKVKKTWAKELVSTAKKAGCKYITLTTRHHDGFSLFDTCGLNDYDALHSPTGRDLVREFVDECNKQGIVPFFYHTLLDWRHPYYHTNFPVYIDYLIDSVEILCKNYGKIGGLWFDGMWDKPDADWQEDRLYATIRKYQPEAMIINNTGLSALGEVGHPEIDSVTFERGKPAPVAQGEKPIAGEMCQVFNDHWGYAENDINYKPVKAIIENLVDCRYCNCNFLLNVGPMGNGSLRPIDAAMLGEIGKWVKANKNFIYNVVSTEIEAENACVLKDEKYYYAVVKDVAMSANVNVALGGTVASVKILTDKKMKNARWLDTGKAVKVKKNSFEAEPFFYGTSRSVRVLRFELK